MFPFTDRANSFGARITLSLYGKLAVGLVICGKNLLSKTKAQIRLIRARHKFYMMSDDPIVSPKLLIVCCLLEEF